MQKIGRFKRENNFTKIRLRRATWRHLFARWLVDRTNMSKVKLKKIFAQWLVDFYWVENSFAFESKVLVKNWLRRHLFAQWLVDFIELKISLRLKIESLGWVFLRFFEVGWNFYGKKSSNWADSKFLKVKRSNAVWHKL